MTENTRPNYPPRRRPPARRRFPINIDFPKAAILAAMLIALIFTLCLCGMGGNAPSQGGTPIITLPTQAPTGPTEPSTEPVDPGITVTGTATMGATGDMLMHMPCVNPALQADGTYDFGAYFTNFSSYVQAVDYAVANLETTFADSNYTRWVNGKKVVGYYGVPSLNTPDTFAGNLKSVGFDMLLTANNHTYDTGTIGFHRTQQIVTQSGLDYTGTRLSEEEAKYLIKDINGIQVGMICYTYETESSPDKVSLNGIPLNATDKKLVNVFLKNDVSGFSADLAENIEDMKADGAEAIVLYIHWGEEYQTKQNSQQKAMAQAACDLGVDVIVGGHPHVIQPLDLLTSTTDDSHKTVCLYSTGNAMSNQRLGNISYVHTAHTEDGIFFTFTFVKYSDGTVRVENVEVLPLWVNLYTSSTTGKAVYDILPLDKAVTDWKTAFKLTDSTLTQANNSYDRTMKIVGSGLDKINEFLDALPEIE